MYFMKERKPLTSQVEIIQFLISCAQKVGIKCYKATNVDDAKTKLLTAELAEKKVPKN